ncbi:nicotinamide riboside transporter PnuC [Asaia astilbis]|uniref:nicotinamide riboside transporter PnuC n=1 Tax=Asaia astilbis TaxID=610244 RepID=UPI000470A733|nr:nicotinamide riboside transporter PnuC [Asaia astilbis]
MSFIEILAVLITMLGIWLMARRHVWGWPCSLLASLLYLAVFAKAQLYADSALQLVFCGFLIKGWIDWHRLKQDAEEIAVTAASLRILLRDVFIGLGCSALLGTILRLWTSDAAPMTDATLSVFSVIGQIWTARRFIACWPLWIVVDGAYVALFIARDLWLSAGLYAGLIALAVYGWSSWRASLRASQQV